MTTTPALARTSNAVPAAVIYAAFVLAATIAVTAPLALIVSGLHILLPLPSWFNVGISFIGVPIAALITLPALWLPGRAGTLGRAAGSIHAASFFLLSQTLFALSMGTAWPILIVGSGAAAAFVIAMTVRAWRKPRPTFPTATADRRDLIQTRTLALTGGAATLTAGGLATGILYTVAGPGYGHIFVPLAVPIVLGIMAIALVVIRRSNRRAIATAEERSA